MDKIQFTKMHGIGNEFVVINEANRFTKNELSSISKKINDRNSGIGSDGLINVIQSNDDDIDLVMNMYNPDGSEAEMCGNGIRCITLFAIDRNIVNKTKDIKIQTGAGILTTSQINGTNIIIVNMGNPSFDLQNDINLIDLDNHQAGDPIDISIGKMKIINSHVVSIGNPHLITFIDNVDKWPLEEMGPLVENHRLFPNRINFEIVELQNANNIKVRVWERGAGITLACGTGACASFFAAMQFKGIDSDNVNVHLPGGVLKLSYYDNNIFMEGPAEYLFEGDWQIS
jgi:diaminopimelate epimerase